MQIQEFEHRQFFAANDVSLPTPRRGLPPDEDDDEPIDDLPPPAWFRRPGEREAFPACDALLCWPSNYPVDGDADLSEVEEAEEDPARFRYSEPELEAWATVVAEVLSQADGDRPGTRPARPLPARTGKRPAPERELEVIDMQNPTYQQQPQGRTQARERMPPPVARFSAGGLTVSVWHNPAPSGGHFQTFSIDRRYRGRDGALGSTKSLRLTDLPVAAALLQKAFGELAFAVNDSGVSSVVEGGLAPSPALAGRDAFADDDFVGQER